MKAIMINNKQIISLENVKEIKLHENGTGAKKNPYYCYIIVYYMNGETSSTCYWDSLENAQNYLNKMFQIITAE